MVHRTIILSVDPVSKPRMTQRDKWQKRPAVVAYRAFADNLRREASRNGLKMPEAGASIAFNIPMPTSWSRKKRDALRWMPHQQKPDLDNLLKAVFDALLPEDCTVWGLGSCEKRWAEQGSITFTFSAQEAQ